MSLVFVPSTSASGRIDRLAELYYYTRHLVLTTY